MTKSKGVEYTNDSVLDEIPLIANARTAGALLNGLNFYEKAVNEGIFNVLPSHLKSRAYKEAIAFIMAHDSQIRDKYNQIL